MIKRFLGFKRNVQTQTQRKKDLIISSDEKHLGAAGRKKDWTLLKKLKLFWIKCFLCWNNVFRQAKIRKTFYYGHSSSLNGLVILIFGLKLYLNMDVPKPKRLWNLIVENSFLTIVRTTGNLFEAKNLFQNQRLFSGLYNWRVRVNCSKSICSNLNCSTLFFKMSTARQKNLDCSNKV